MEVQARLSMDGVAATIEAARQEVLVSPDDLGARLDLAWDLFLLAVHCDGVERSGKPSIVVDAAGVGSEPWESERLLHESVGHLAVVAELDPAFQEGAEGRRMERLIDLAGCMQALRLAREHSAESARAIVREVLKERP